MDNKAIYEKRIVAFVDILGFGTLVEDSKVDTGLRRKIKKAMDLIRESVRTPDGGRVVTTFSDSAVISYPLSQHSSLFYLLLDVIHLQLELGALGIMFRGGIACDDCYHDGDIVFGPAMNEAYRMESKVALWPRVVIGKDALAEGIKASVVGGEEVLEIKKCVKQDDYNEEVNNPELFFVDFLRQPDELIDFGDEYFEWLRQFRSTVVAGLNRYSPANPDPEAIKDEKVFKKYRWLLNYWNSVVSDDSAMLPVPDIDPEYQLKFRKLYKELAIKKRYPYT